MKRIWASWRMQYIEMDKEKGCFLCDKPKQDNDAANYILYRGDKNFIILNSFPYNPGHLLVAPYRHIASLSQLTDDELLEHFKLVSLGVEVLKQAFKANNFNLGINLGRVAGAGLADHIHTHIVPRWSGDTNFMPVVADAKVLPEALTDTYRKLEGKF
ncbi:MAG: HIT domain-containing protein [Chloroflexota bacterium]